MTDPSWRRDNGQQLANRFAQAGWSELRKDMAPLLSHLVALLAMKHRRAPLPVSPALWKGLLRRGFPNDLDELGDFARRYLFLGDERILLAELNRQSGTSPPILALLSEHQEIVPG